MPIGRWHWLHIVIANAAKQSIVTYCAKNWIASLRVTAQVSG
jgi:hypothetical protein